MTQTLASTENKGLGTFRPGGRMLENKSAAVFGAGGSIGAAVAKEFAADDVLLLPPASRRGSAGCSHSPHPCGFSVDEIASAMVSTHTAIEKRITRSKKTLAKSQKLFDVTVPAEFSARLPGVHTALYLLFNEGYHGANPEFAVRNELCLEAMRLTAVLLEHPLCATPATYALAALMCLNAARLAARIDASGDLRSLFDQNRTAWDQQLISEGMSFLDLSAKGSEVSEYHIEAAIASVHATARGIEDTDWAKIVSLYDSLILIRSSPVVALNRAIAIGQRDGPDKGIEEIRTILDADRLALYPFYWAALGEFELRSKRYEKAREHFHSALTLARNEAERNFFTQRLHAPEED